MMASFLLVIVSKKNKQTKKNMSFIADGFDTNFYEQWSTGPPAERIWWSDNFFSGPDNN